MPKPIYNPAELSEVELQVHRKLRTPAKRRPRADVPRKAFSKVHTFVNPTTIHQFNPRTGVTTIVGVQK